MYKCRHWTRCDENSQGDLKKIALGAIFFALPKHSQGVSQSETKNFFETKAGKWQLVYKQH
jgi:hypothetical protein